MASANCSISRAWGDGFSWGKPSNALLYQPVLTGCTPERLPKAEDGMRRGYLFCSLVVVMTMPGLAAAFAQSGVVSGPPQVNSGPNRGPNTGPGIGGPNRPSGPSSPGPGLGPGTSGPGTPPGQGETWIAVAAGFDGRGGNVSVGYSGHRGSRNEAEDSALSVCNGYGRGVRCRNPFAVATGCLYIVPGSRRGGVTWGRGATRDLALRECRKNGHNCDSGRVVGGCVPGYAN